MRCFIGIDLGSTTTKAVVIDEHQNILGRGITNSRSNYDTAAAIAKQEALVNSRFHLFRQALGTSAALDGALDGALLQSDLRKRAARRARTAACRLPQKARTVLQTAMSSRATWDRCSMCATSRTPRSPLRRRTTRS